MVRTLLPTVVLLPDLGGKGNRDGSFAYYIGEPVIENDPKSVGSFILAAIEYEKMK